MKIFRKILLGAVLTVLGLVTFTAASIYIDGWIGTRRLDGITNVAADNGSGGAVRAYVARPPGAGPHPTVIMIHEFYGLNVKMRDKADHLARAGYVVIAPDMFRGSATSWIPRAIYQTLTTPQEQRNTDLDAVYAWLEQQPEVDPGRVAVIGFCFGGATSLRYSLWNPRLAATAVFYGSPLTDSAELKSLPGPRRACRARRPVKHGNATDRQPAAYAGGHRKLHSSSTRLVKVAGPPRAGRLINLKSNVVAREKHHLINHRRFSVIKCAQARPAKVGRQPPASAHAEQPQQQNNLRSHHKAPALAHCVSITHAKQTRRPLLQPCAARTAHVRIHTLQHPVTVTPI